MDAFLNFLEQVATQPCLLVGLISFIGLVIQKKPVEDIVSGSIKAAVGVLLISAGAGSINTALTPANTMLTDVFGITGVLAVNETCFAVAVEQFGTMMAGILILGMILNLVLAKLTRFKFIYLTGHEAMWISTVSAIVLSSAGLPLWQVVVGGAIVVGLYMVTFPALIYKSVCKVTGTDKVAIGHTGILYYWIAVVFAKLFKNNPKDCENVNVSKKLNFLRDLTVSTAISMFLFNLVVSAVAWFVNPEATAEVYGGNNLFIQSVINGMNFGVGIFVIQAGVRMVIAELVPAFKGVADKFIPNSVPALDIPIVFPYQPNSVLIGFVTASISMIIVFLIQVATANITGLPVLIPTLFCSFFFGATMGALCNKEGGLKGVIVGTFVGTVAFQYLPALAIGLGNVLVSGTTFGGSDSSFVGIVLGGLNNLFGSGVLFPFIVVLFVLFVIVAFDRKGSKGN